MTKMKRYVAQTWLANNNDEKEKKKILVQNSYWNYIDHQSIWRDDHLEQSKYEMKSIEKHEIN